MTIRPAERVLRDLGVESPEEINLEAIAWHLGAAVKYRPLRSCEARILGNGDRAIICIDAGKSPSRQRFSIGHELGHWRHHRGRCLICRSEDIGNRTRGPFDPERIADQYAAELLLPEYLLRPAARTVTTWNLRAIREVANLFSASRTATAIRLAELDLFPGMVVCHEAAGRRWFARPPSFHEWMVPSKDLNAESRAYGILTGSEEETRFPSTIDADAFFTFRRADTIQLKEQSFRVPEGVVTLLMFDNPRVLQ